MDWLSLLGSTATGGILGMVGSIAGEALKFVNRREDHRQRVELLKLEAEMRAAGTAGDIAVARERGAADAFVESQRAESSVRGEHRWATTYRAITRPSLTHLGLLASIAFATWPPTSEVGQLLAMTVQAYTGMMIAWWFGQRQLDRGSIQFGNQTASASVSSKQPTAK